MKKHNDKPTIEPHKITQYSTKQSKYDVVPKLPCRSILLGPSGSGKTILLQQLIMKIYDKCFDRIYIFSPSINIDHTWKPVKQYIEKVMEVKETDKEKFYYDHYDHTDLEKILELQHHITKYMKDHKHTKLFQILIVIDDFADDPKFTRYSKLLHSLYTRGRHNCISTITSTQKFNALATIIRVNATDLYVFRLRNYKEIEALTDEVSALIDKKTFLEIYHTATEEQYSFLFINLVSKDIDHMFHIKFDSIIQVKSSSSRSID